MIPILHTLLSISAAGIVGYAALILVLRASGKRTLAKLNAFDFVVTIALGSCFANVLLSDEESMFRGIFAFVVLASLQYIVAWISVRFPAIGGILRAEPCALVVDGNVLQSAMDKNRVTHAELAAAIRGSGHGSLSKIASVILETNGTISVVSRDNMGDKSALPN